MISIQSIKNSSSYNHYSHNNNINALKTIYNIIQGNKIHFPI